MSALAGHATLAPDMVGWPYHRDLDLTGFIDGTENPSLAEAMAEVVIPDDLRGEGGSVLLRQQWQHDVRGMLAAMLDSMVGRAGEGRDELTRYTTAISGAYYIVPSLEALGAFARA